jgi:hypothetical protein
MHLQKVISKKTDEKGRIRIRNSLGRIRGSGSISDTTNNWKSFTLAPQFLQGLHMTFVPYRTVRTALSRRTKMLELLGGFSWGYPELNINQSSTRPIKDTNWAVLRIRDVYPGSRIQGRKDSGSGSASKNLSIFNPKNCFYALGS